MADNKRKTSTKKSKKVSNLRSKATPKKASKPRSKATPKKASKPRSKAAPKEMEGLHSKAAPKTGRLRDKALKVFRNPVFNKISRVGKTVTKGLGLAGAGLEGMADYLENYEKFAPSPELRHSSKFKRKKFEAAGKAALSTGGKLATAAAAFRIGNLVPGPAGFALGTLGAIGTYTLGDQLTNAYAQSEQAKNELDAQRFKFIKEYGMTPEEARQEYENRQRNRSQRR